jgi:transcriptional regulator with XRE-family HTH domain
MLSTVPSTPDCLTASRLEEDLTPDWIPTEQTSTTATGPMVSRGDAVQLILVAGTLSPPGTSGAPPLPAQRRFEVIAQTTSGPMPAEHATTGSMLFALRRLSGLSLQQLSQLLGLSRHQLHLWASGKPMAPAKEERLARTLATVRRIDRGSASENRSLLLTPLADGTRPLELLEAGRHDELLALLRPGRAQRPELTPLSLAAREARKPRPPAELVAALQDTGHREVGKGRPVRIGKAKRSRDRG